MNLNEEKYWSNRYMEERTGWDIGYPSTPITTYADQLKDKSLKILIPGAGNSYEAEYLHTKGFKNVHILDIAKQPLDAFTQRNKDFPQDQIIYGDFFNHEGKYDLIIEQPFFCSFVPTDENRQAYAKKIHSLLKPKGKLVGLWFNFPLTEDMDRRPFGGDKALYLNYINPWLTVISFEDCYNSILERQGKELFGIFERK